jgi:hypothetical protein
MNRQIILIEKLQITSYTVKVLLHENAINCNSGCSMPHIKCQLQINVTLIAFQRQHRQRLLWLLVETKYVWFLNNYF